MKWRLLAGLLMVGSAQAAEVAVRIALQDFAKWPSHVAIDSPQRYAQFVHARVQDADLPALNQAGVRWQLDANRVEYAGRSVDLKLAIAEGRALDATRLLAPGWVLLQFDGPIQQSWLDVLRATQIEPQQYVAGNAYLAFANNASTRAWQQPFLRAASVLAASDKIEPSVVSRADVNAQIENVNLQILGRLRSQTLASLRDLGVLVLRDAKAQPDGFLIDIVARPTVSQLEQIAALPGVLSLSFLSAKPAFDDELSSQILAGNYSASDQVTNNGYLSYLQSIGLSGSGVIWAITDSGIDRNHPDFQNGKIAGGSDYPGCTGASGAGDDATSGGHGTHVAGILAGNGALNFLDPQGFNYGLGVAPSARLFAQNPICSTRVSWPPAGGWQELSKRALLGGAIGTNNSWTSGEGTNVGYTAGARAFDLMVRDGNFDTVNINEAFVVAFSAGNSGPGAGTLTSPKEAKNAIITASSVNQRAGAITGIASSSSRGPTRDGRFGVTITAPGQTIASTRRVAGASSCGTAIAGTSNNYSLCSGTSMASPHAAGTAALLVEWWRGRNGGATPSPAMLKALMVIGAIDLIGVAETVPNNTEGWGRIHLPNTLGANDARFYVDQSELLSDPGAVYERRFTSADNSKPVRVSVVWTDAPAAIGATTITTVNDLDLRVVSAGSIYLGNRIASGVSTTGGAPDRRNNIESVFLPPGTGSFTLQIEAFNLPADGVPNSGDGTDQDFALVCSNCQQQPTFTLNAGSGSMEICAGSARGLNIQSTSEQNFTTPIQLSISGLGNGASSGFAPNPLTPGSSSLMTISTNTSAAAGRFAAEVLGEAGAQMLRQAIDIGISGGPAASANLQSPADNSATVALTGASFTWTDSGALDYQFQLASNANFSSVVFQKSVRTNSLILPVSVTLAPGQSYFWRVVARSACAAPPQFELFADGFEIPASVSFASSTIFRFTSN